MPAATLLASCPRRSYRYPLALVPAVRFHQDALSTLLGDPNELTQVCSGQMLG